MKRPAIWLLPMVAGVLGFTAIVPTNVAFDIAYVEDCEPAATFSDNSGEVPLPFGSASGQNGACINCNITGNCNVPAGNADWTWPAGGWGYEYDKCSSSNIPAHVHSVTARLNAGMEATTNVTAGDGYADAWAGLSGTFRCDSVVITTYSPNVHAESTGLNDADTDSNLGWGIAPTSTFSQNAELSTTSSADIQFRSNVLGDPESATATARVFKVRHQLECQ